MNAQHLVLPFDHDTRQHDLGRDLRIAADSDVPILITGDREAAGVVARAVHDGNPVRRSARFVIGRHDTLFETLASMSTRFRGTYVTSTEVTASVTPTTLYLDQVEQLPPDAQEMLMYFLDVTRGSQAADGQTRVVASAENLASRVTSGLFREDLYYRLNVIHLAMPRFWGPEDPQLQSLLASLSA